MFDSGLNTLLLEAKQKKNLKNEETKKKYLLEQ